MIDDQVVAEFAALIGFSIMVVLVKLWLDHFADALREDLFALRDEMMVYAYRENLIDNLAYRNLRFLMNGFIRYAHKLSFSRLMLMRAARKWAGLALVQPPEEKEWRKAVAALPAEQRAAFEQFNERANLRVLKHLILHSPTVWLFFLPYTLAHVRLRSIFNGLVQINLIKLPKTIVDKLAKTLQPKMPMEQAVEGALHAARAISVG